MNEAIIGFVGVLIGVVATLGKDALSYWTRRRKAGRYAAIRIVSVLDLYVEQCVGVVGDDGTAEGRPAGRTEQGQDYLVAQVATPEPPTFPDDIDWTSINADLMYRVLALPNLAAQTERIICAANEHAYPPDFEEFFEARQEGYADLGLEALELAKALQQKFKLPKQSLDIGNPDWDSATFLLERKQDMLRLREAQRRANTEMWDRLSEPSQRNGEPNTDSGSSPGKDAKE